MEEDFFRERKVQKRKFHGTLYTRKAIENLLPTIDKDVFKQNFPCPPPEPSNFAICSSVTCTRNSIYIAGKGRVYIRILIWMFLLSSPKMRAIKFWVSHCLC